MPCPRYANGAEMSDASACCACVNYWPPLCDRQASLLNGCPSLLSLLFFSHSMPQGGDKSLMVSLLFFSWFRTPQNLIFLQPFPPQSHTDWWDVPHYWIDMRLQGRENERFTPQNMNPWSCPSNQKCKNFPCCLTFSSFDRRSAVNATSW